MLYPFSEYYDRLSKAELVKYAYLADAPYLGDITAVCDNSSDAVKGCMFVCKGNNFKEEYLFDAINKGASCYVAEKEYAGADVPAVIVTDARSALAEAAALYYDEPWRKIPVIGVTGTKGKSTVVYYIKAILDEYFRRVGKKPCGLVSTIETYDGRTRYTSMNSTPESLKLTEIIDNAYRSGLSAVVCEVSSQALKYGRVRSVEFAASVMTNIGIDHISAIEHSDFEDYFSSKLAIFDRTKTAVINCDMEGEHLERVKESASRCKRIIYYGEGEGADMRAYDMKISGLKTRFMLSLYEQIFEIPSPGFFNVSNAAAAACVARLFGAEEEDIGNALKHVSVPGRMEMYVSADRDIIALVDYAHNELSFETVFDSVSKGYPDYRLISVFGCPGGKAELRRRALGRIAGRYCDTVYITSDDPDFEDPVDIASEIALGVEESGGRWRFIEDRSEATFAALADALPGTVVMLLGCGNETRQKIRGKAVPCLADAECVKLAFDGKNSP